MRSTITRPAHALVIKLVLAGGAVIGQSGYAAEASPCPPLAADQRLTLSAAINYGLCQNPDTRSVWAQLTAQQAAVAVSEDANKPSVALQASTNRSFSDGDQSSSTALQARLSYLLFDFGQRQAEQQQARALAEAAQWSVDSTTASLSRDIIMAYVMVLKAQAQIDAVAQALIAASNSLSSAEARYKAGTATPLDVLQAKAAEAQARLATVQARSLLATRRGELAQIMGLKPTLLPELASVASTPLELPFQVDTLAQMLVQAVNARAETRVARANVSAAEQSILSAKAANKASISLSASTGVQQSDDDRQSTGSLGLTLAVPLDVGGGQKARIRQSEALKAVKEAALVKSQQTIEQQVWQAFYAAQAAIETVRAAQDSLDSSERASQVALGRYQAGVGAMLEVLTAQSQFAASQQQLAAARYDWLTARMQLAYALGQQLLPAIRGVDRTESIQP